MKVLFFVTVLLGSSWSLTFVEYKATFNKTYKGLESNIREGIYNLQSILIREHQYLFRVGVQQYSVDFNHLTDTGFNEKYRKSFEVLPSDVQISNGKNTVISKDSVPTNFTLKMPPTEILDQSE